MLQLNARKQGMLQLNSDLQFASGLNLYLYEIFRLKTKKIN